jgi:hypothetical protein
LLGAGAVVGAVLASTLSASAAENAANTQAATLAYSSTAPAAGPGGRRQAPGKTAPVRSDEKALTGDDATKAGEAALGAVPGGTVYRVETDAGDGEYEAHMTKSDGILVTVKLDKDFNVISVEDGIGTGDPASTGQNNTESGD